MKKVLLWLVIVGLFLFPVAGCIFPSTPTTSPTSTFPSSSVSAGVWKQLLPVNSPPVWVHTMVYDSIHDKLIVFGGRNPRSYCNDTYVYDFATNAWTNAQANNPPPARAYHAMAFDKIHSKILLFGGATDSTSYGDTWAYDYATNSWTNMDPGSSPPPLSGHTMVFDSMNQRIILFGGSDENNKDSNVTWAYNFEENTWRDLHATNPPTARHYHGMVFDENQQKAIVYGGIFVQDDLSDTWAYDPNSNSWSERKPNGSPGPTSHILGGMAYDSKNSCTVLFGGWGGVGSTGYEGTYQAQPKNSTWIYDYVSNAWTALNTNPSPSARYFHCLSFDSTRGLVWLVGGGSDFVTSKDTWSLSLGPNPILSSPTPTASPTPIPSPTLTRSPEAAIQNWMDTWIKADLEALLKLSSPAFQADSASVYFYEWEFSRYTKLSYSNLQVTVVDTKPDKVLVEARFNFELESLSTTPNVQSGSARHIYTLVKIGGKWLVDSVERSPG